MRTGLCLSVLGLLGLLSVVFGQEAVDVQSGVHIFCDDPSVEKAVSSALQKFNERLNTGYKLALFQIITASKSENGSNNNYALQFTSRRSDCLAGSPKPWTDCNYLPYGRQDPLSCNATVHMTEDETDTDHVHCALDDYIHPERASCLGCPMPIDENSEDLKVPLSVSIVKYNSISNSTHLFNLNSVESATRQVVAGFRFKLRFDMRRTTCAKAEHSDLSDLCVHDGEEMEFINCNSTVDVAPWRFEAPQVSIICEEGALPPQTQAFSRRLPPGWTPFREAMPTFPSPTLASGKEESSEEDATASPTAGAAEAENDNPFHCPSKPWKKFHPVQTGLPVAPTMAGTPVPPTNRPLLDEDLLA
ncbi:kininogen-1 [Dunckerocampus dactyliophorus]|uniref:kininogen-1 n=1 Tax=Dunckerocampus dactyliophorus TaxID=161453 RepID=UPI002406609A|nr:kininogen-1 [Dunckerocampus dactyliophorus]